MLKSLTRTRNAMFRGVTLIEGLLFMGLAAIAIISGVALYNNASNSSKMNQAQTQIQAYIAGVKSLYGSRDSYDSLNNQLIIAAGKAPDNAIRGTTELHNPWGGPTTITGTRDNFSIVLGELTTDACTALLSANMLDNGSIYQLRGNSTSFINGNNPDPVAAMNACNQTGDRNTVTFTVR
jgi:type II secretory pathway pseudopilin PulG